MKRTTKTDSSLSSQVRARAHRPKEEPVEEYDGNFGTVISTGSTLLDLAISGGRVHGGGIPLGILVEIFGPNSSGKTTLLCEIAGTIQRMGGEVKFQDPESRLDTVYAQLFDLHLDPKDVEHPKTPVDVFKQIRGIHPTRLPYGVFTDSTASLQSDLELEDKTDEYSRRAKLLSQECRKTCQIIKERNLLVVFSNQIRQNMNATSFGEKFSVPGGEAVGFYASLRLRFHKPTKIRDEAVIKGNKIKQVIGTEVNVEVYKSSVWKAYRKVPLTLLDDYGIDDVRENLKYLKQFSNETVYTIGDIQLGKSLKGACQLVEEEGFEDLLKEEVIRTWKEVERHFATNRTKRRI